MTIYSQLDPKWSKMPIGKTKITVGQQGCTLTDICMVASYFGETITPAQLSAVPGLFNKDAKIIWSVLNKVFKTFQWDYRGYGNQSAKIKQHLTDPNKAVILQVNNEQHWVLPTKTTPDNKSYAIIDPWGGVRIPDVIKKYKNITGSSYFSRKITMVKK